MYKSSKIKKELGESYQHFMPWQVPDFDARARDLKWWQWPIFCVAFVGLMVFFLGLKTYELVRYRGKKDFVPGMAKYDYRAKLEEDDD